MTTRPTSCRPQRWSLTTGPAWIAETAHPLRGLEVRGEARLEPEADAMALIRRLGERYGQDVGSGDFATAYEPGSLEVARLEPGIIRAWDYRDEF